MYGSMATGLVVESSDLDIAVRGVDAINSKQKLEECIGRLCQELCKLPYVELCKPILTARIPVIKLVPFAVLDR